MFETIHATVAQKFWEQVEEICLADSGGPGLGFVRQSLWAAGVASRHNAHILGHEVLRHFLQMFVVVIDREPELA